MGNNYRIYVEKKPEFRIEAESLKSELNENLEMNIGELRLLNVYDLFGFTADLLERSRYSVFGETVTDDVLDDCDLGGRNYIAVEYLPGQFDQRAASAADCVRLIDPAARITIKSSRLLIFDGGVTAGQLEKIKKYYINGIEAREKDLSVLSDAESTVVKPVPVLTGFRDMGEADMAAYCRDNGLAMNADDLREVVNYFCGEGRDPSLAELKILDTYWSDHCRHTTFMTVLENIHIDDSFIRKEIEESLELYYKMRGELGRTGKPVCLMDMATIGARHLRKNGFLSDLEVSDENNACSIFIDVDVNGRTEKWLLQFKNETHNHPTEIEPFGGASTCLGGAIRDPLSGRSYVYQAMRVTGAGDIYLPVGQTMAGKLPQRVISTKAAHGYSSYGNQIGLATTHVREIYHDGYVAKRLEVGAVVGAVKAENVRRESPAAGDIILLLGGRTGRDGIGGATGSSKQHDVRSLEECGSEVQKGNAPEERKLQRLFRREEVARLIKKSNDFGAGGVSVAIGELAEGVDVYLDRVPVKYRGLNSMELAISESQERMAVVIEPAAREEFERYCAEENVEVTHVADVTGLGRMRMFNGGEKVVDLGRDFIDSAGAAHYASAAVGAVSERNPFVREIEGATLGDKIRKNLSDRNVLTQKGMAEMFDSTVGATTVLMPFGGSTQRSEVQVSAQKIPVRNGFTDTASIMACGYNPFISSWSPYHGAAYAVVEAAAKVVAAGGRYGGMRFSYQEFFEKMTSDAHSWGKPLAALLGALKMQHELRLPSIGGKDSMSGTFGSLNVPPTLIAFGITTADAGTVISTDFKREGNYIYLVKHTPKADYMPDTELLKENWEAVSRHIESGDIVSAYAVGFGGVGEALAKMAFGNNTGADIRIETGELFDYSYGSIVVESRCELVSGNMIFLGTTMGEAVLTINGERMPLEELWEANTGNFSKIYPLRSDSCGVCGATAAENKVVSAESSISQPATKVVPAESHISETGNRVTLADGAVPMDANEASKANCCTNDSARDKVSVYLPAFPGTNCDYDTARAFERAGAQTKIEVFRNLTGGDILSSIERMAEGIAQCDIFVLSGGFSMGDEPDGSAKFIVNVLNNAAIAEQIHALLDRGGLILGICNGFQALVKSGLLPYGRLGTVTAQSPTLFRNDINRHISHMVRTRVSTLRSPWLSGFAAGDIHTIAVSHGEGKFVVGDELAQELFRKGQVAFQYVDDEGRPTAESPFNPNGSSFAIEGIIDHTGQILGKMGHMERYDRNLFKNIPGDKSQDIFANAVNYFHKKQTNLKL